MKSDIASVNKANNVSALGKGKLLNGSQIDMINEALAKVGDFGEIRLVVQNGRLRFIVTQKSVDALKWKPGSLEE